MWFIKKSLIFVYSPSHRYTGSTVMRGEQLSEIAKRALKKQYNVHFEPITKRFRNSILFLTKGALHSYTVEQLVELKHRNNLIIIDPNDSIVPAEKVRLVDVIVSSSRIGCEAHKEQYPDRVVAIIDHHVDPRIKPLAEKDRLDEFRAGYFGEPVNTIITPNIERMVDFVHVDTSSQSDKSWIDKIPTYNFHYAIRNRRSFDGYKPATKVFTAARCKSNVLVQDAEYEAAAWLGEDYPYLLKGKVTEGKILSMLNLAKDSYGSEMWRHGLSIMKKIDQQISEDAIGRQIYELLKRIDK